MKEYKDSEEVKRQLRIWIQEAEEDMAHDTADCFRDCIDLLDDVPAADVVEVRHGRWLLERTPDGKPYCFHCSVCDDDFHHIGIMTVYDYCPNCGAYMMGESNGKCE